jgi:hypothetical protein
MPIWDTNVLGPVRSGSFIAACRPLHSRRPCHGRCSAAPCSGCSPHLVRGQGTGRSRLPVSSCLASSAPRTGPREPGHVPRTPPAAAQSGRSLFAQAPFNSRSLRNASSIGMSVGQLWNELFPPEQARIVRSLVERVVVGPTGADIRLRLDELDGLAGRRS